MRNRTLAAGISFLTMAVAWGAANAAPAASAPETYAIDPVHSTVIFNAQHFGAGLTYGRFREVSGTITADPKKPVNSKVVVEVKAESLYTGEMKRDKHLTGPDFLNTKQFPTIKFESTKIRKQGKGFAVVGNLTLHGVTKEVQAQMRHTGVGTDPEGKQRAGFVAELSIKRGDFGMTKLVGPVSDKIDLTIALEGIKQ